MQIIEEVVQHGKLAVRAIERAARHVTRNQEEFERLRNDIHCYDAFANFFAQKVRSAALVLRYQHSNDIADLDAALPYLERSLDYWRELVRLTEDTYLYANSMHTSHRRVPITGADGANKTWAEMLPHYERELENFKKNIARLKDPSIMQRDNVEPLENVRVRLMSHSVGRLISGGDMVRRYADRYVPIETFRLAEGERLFSDQPFVIQNLGEELKGLTAIRLPMEEMKGQRTRLTFTNDVPVQVLVGFFNSNHNSYLQPPTPEVDANASSHGQADARIVNALFAEGLPSVTIHSYTFERGTNTLSLARGAALILGFVSTDHELVPRDAGFSGGTRRETVDWLFY